ncbi:MAG: hypothetical protein ACLGI6_17515 [Gammaproteobacteria bacterium]
MTGRPRATRLGVCWPTWLAWLAALALPGRALAAEASTVGLFTLEARLFADPAQVAGQRRHGLGAVLDVEHRWRAGADAFNLQPYVRTEPSGSYIDLREALWERDVGKFSLRAGFHKVFWGVMESNHLIDIVNQSDLAADPDGEEKFGQPMVGLGLNGGALGRLDFMYMPYFRERLLPGPKARLRPDPPVAQDSGWTRGGRWHPDAVLRWSNSMEAADVGLYLFRGLSREPDLALAAGAPARLRDSYRPITQFGADVQVPQGSMMWKGEAIYRRGHGRPFAAFSIGGEYTLPIEAGDLGLLLEWSRDFRQEYDGVEGGDGVDGVDGGVLPAPATAFRNALFAGLRLRLNSQHDSELLVGQQLDRAHRMRFLSLEFNRRLGENWKLSVEARRFSTRAATPYPYDILQGESYLQARVSYYF